MAFRVQFGRFEFQVRMVLVLLVLFLAVLDVLNLVLLSRAKDALERAEREHAMSRVRALTDDIGPAILVSAVLREEDRGRLTSSALRKVALGFGYDRVALLDRAGREVLGSGPTGQSLGTGYEDLAEGHKSALAGGRPATGHLVPRSGGDDARLTVFMPLLDTGGRLVGIVEAVRPVPDLGSAEKNFRLVVAVQVAAVIVIAGLVLLFANWISRPYRRLAEAAGDAGLTSGDDVGAGDPDALATAFQAVVAKLREQDEAMGSVSQAGGLGDLVRFASKAARNMSTGVLVFDRQGRVAAMNPAASSLLGYDRPETVGRTLDEVADRVEGLAPRVRVCLQRGIGASREVLAVHRSGGPVSHLGVSISPASGWDDEVSGALVLMTDLTEIRRLQEQARLRESLAAVGKLSAGIAHEFRNALGTILGYAKMLAKTSDSEVRGPATQILKEVDSVRASVDEFLLYARPPKPGSDPVSIETVIHDCVETAGPRLEIEIRGEFGDALADEGLLRRTFSNLIRNAEEAAREAGRAIHVRISGHHVAGGRTLRLDVEDDGPGIPDEIRDQVFVPFVTARAGGTGLGLALVQRTLVDLGGSVEAGQSPMGGALFRMRIPLVETPARVR